jgi:hypothetical protein
MNDDVVGHKKELQEEKADGHYSTAAARAVAIARRLGKRLAAVARNPN